MFSKYLDYLCTRLVLWPREAQECRHNFEVLLAAWSNGALWQVQCSALLYIYSLPFSSDSCIQCRQRNNAGTRLADAPYMYPCSCGFIASSGR